MQRLHFPQGYIKTFCLPDGSSVKTMGSLFFLARCSPPRHFAFQPSFTTNYKKATPELNMHYAFQKIF